MRAPLYRQNRDAVVVISSHVARGSVGNRAIVPALERLGFTVWAVPTILLPHHPGHGVAERIIPDEKCFTGLLHTLVQGGRAASVAGIVSGYLASDRQVDAVAALVRAVTAVRPETVYLCDPVIGDSGSLYVGDSIATAIRDVLLPLADAITPNAFECAWLAGAGQSAPDVVQQARRLPPQVKLVTSAAGSMHGRIGNVLIADGETLLFEHPAVATPAKGTGDLLAAILLARRLEGYAWKEAAELAIASTFEIVAATAQLGADELAIPQNQDSIVRPRVAISVTEWES